MPFEAGPCANCGTVLTADDAVCPYCRRPRATVPAASGRGVPADWRGALEDWVGRIALAAVAVAAAVWLFGHGDGVLQAVRLAGAVTTTALSSEPAPAQAPAAAAAGKPEARGGGAAPGAQGAVPPPSSAAPAVKPPPPDPPGDDSLTFYGVVYDMDTGLPVPQATVTARLARALSGSGTVSDAAGHYRLTMFRANGEQRYVVEAAAAGYRRGQVEDGTMPGLDSPRADRLRAIAELSAGDLEPVPVTTVRRDGIYPVHLMLVPEKPSLAPSR